MRRLALAVLLASLAGTAAAEMKPFDINMERVTLDIKKPMGFSTTYFVPTVNIRVSAAGSVWAEDKGFLKQNNSKAHGRFFVKGLDKAFVQGLAQKVQDDLVAKLRAAGYTVLTYDDLKGEADVAGLDREKADDKWGLPLHGKDGLDFVTVTPSDAQAFDAPIQGPVWKLRGLAKDKQLTVIVPEMTLEVPLMSGQVESSYATFKAGIGVLPAMRLDGATVWAMDGKERQGTILIQQHGKRLASENAGTPKLMDEDTTTFNKYWAHSSSDWVMDLDPQAFSDGVLRVGYAINTLITEQAKKAH